MARDRLVENQTDNIIKIRKQLRANSSNLLAHAAVLGQFKGEFTDSSLLGGISYFDLTDDARKNYQTTIGHTFIEEVRKVRDKASNAEEGRVNMAQTLQYMMIWASDKDKGDGDGRLFDFYLVEAIALAQPEEVAQNPLLLHRAMCMLVNPSLGNQAFIAAYRATGAIYQAIKSNQEALLKEWQKEEDSLTQRISDLERLKARGNKEIDDEIKSIDGLIGECNQAIQDLTEKTKALKQKQTSGINLDEDEKKSLTEDQQLIKDLKAAIQRHQKEKSDYEALKTPIDKKSKNSVDILKYYKGELVSLKNLHNDYKKLLGNMDRYGSFLNDSSVKPGSGLDVAKLREQKEAALSANSSMVANAGRYAPRALLFSGAACAFVWLFGIVSSPFITLIPLAVLPDLIIAAGALFGLSLVVTLLAKLAPMVAGGVDAAGKGLKKVGGALDSAGQWIGEKLENLKDADPLKDINNLGEKERNALEDSDLLDSTEWLSRGQARSIPELDDSVVGLGDTGLGADIGSAGVGLDLGGGSPMRETVKKAVLEVAPGTVNFPPGVSAPELTTHDMPIAHGAPKPDPSQKQLENNPAPGKNQ